MPRRIAIIIASSNFRDEELTEPKKEIDNAGFDSTIFSSKKGISKAMFGYEIKVDSTLNDIDIKEFDAIVFIGGTGSSEFFENKKAHEIVNLFNNKKKLVAAICIAPKIFANAGILKDKKVCSFPSVKNDLKKCGAIVQKDGVEVDGNIITATGPEFAQKFGQEIVKYFNQS